MLTAEIGTPPDGLTVRLMAWRRRLRRAGRTAHVLRCTRALVHFGPWRHVARAIVRQLRPPRGAGGTSVETVLPAHEPRRVARALHQDGLSVVGTLSAATLEPLRAVTDALPAGEFGQFHLHDRHVAALVSDAGVLAVLREHLGAEPVLLECTVVVHEPSAMRLTPTAAPAGRRPDPQRQFHFDYAGWQSLNLFVYLSDVGAASGPHELARGTHRTRRWRDALLEMLPDDEVQRRFGDRVTSITGPAGTLFFEDTEAFHRRGALTERRVMLNVLFASHRGVLSRGRLARSYGEYLQRRGGADVRLPGRAR